MTKARHRTVLLTTAGTCFVQEGRNEVLRRMRGAPDDWFEATADPEGDPISVNARNVVVVSRVRTPLEEMQAAPAFVAEDEEDDDV